MSRLDDAQARLDAAISRLEAAIEKAAARAPGDAQTADLAAALEQAQQERIALRDKADVVGMRLDATIERLREILGEQAG